MALDYLFVLLTHCSSNRGNDFIAHIFTQVGSFLMGWLGIIQKGDISRFSDLLAIGLTTGFLGSLTTFSGWNQKMLELASNGKWAFVVIGYSTGKTLVSTLVRT